MFRQNGILLKDGIPRADKILPGDRASDPAADFGVKLRIAQEAGFVSDGELLAGKGGAQRLELNPGKLVHTLAESLEIEIKQDLAHIEENATDPRCDQSLFPNAQSTAA